MTKRAFKIHAQGTLGLAEPEWGSWWLDDPSIDRDNEGFGGDLQLYVPLGKQRERARETGITNELHEGSRQMKDPTEKDLGVLKEHIHNQEVSMADAFITSATSTRSKSLAVDHTHGQTAAEQVQKRRKKKHDVDRTRRSTTQLCRTTWRNPRKSSQKQMRASRRP